VSVASNTQPEWKHPKRIYISYQLTGEGLVGALKALSFGWEAHVWTEFPEGTHSVRVRHHDRIYGDGIAEGLSWEEYSPSAR